MMLGVGWLEGVKEVLVVLGVGWVGEVVGLRGMMFQGLCKGGCVDALVMVMWMVMLMILMWFGVGKRDHLCCRVGRLVLFYVMLCAFGK